jgi:hypothetical protein
MYELKKNWIFTSKFVGTGPSSYNKRIYRAAVSQRLRNTGLEHSPWHNENDRPINDITYVRKQNRWASLSQQGGGMRCEIRLDSLQRGSGLFYDIHSHTHTHKRWGVTCGPVLQCLQSVKQKKAPNERSYIFTVPLGPAVGRWGRFDATGSPRSCSIQALVIKKKNAVWYHT